MRVLCTMSMPHYHFCVYVLRHLHDTLHSKWPRKWKIYCDFVPAHLAHRESRYVVLLEDTYSKKVVL